ncbi:ABC-2 family transporter protein [Seinonella peptonophila]|uniref:ABC-2 family transporter protein n=1 Tax=Seinonella peptonophila TaxID=112248 RepID=A0A1M4U1M4_9BACL|nr:ABC transporter permease [Seinonella peptonophila]SHE50474.1 ABC-2 family transporter protein [Seinonella peptonophila]
MIKLIRLEYKKVRLTRFLLISVLAVVILMLWCIGNKSGHPEGYDSYQAAFAEINFYTNSTFLIISSVLITKIILDEYRKKTIMILFTYPHSRKRLMVAKLAFISLFTFCVTLVANFSVTSLFIFLAPTNQANLGLLTNDQMLDSFLRICLYALATTGINFISFFFGMFKKSPPATIIPPFLISLIISSHFYQLYSIWDVLISTISCLVIGVLLAHYGIKKAVQLDVE